MDDDDLVKQLLNLGWELLAATPGTALPMYTLGHRAKEQKELKNSPDALKKAEKSR